MDAFAATQEASDALDVLVNSYSLESELAIAGNEELLKGVYLKLRPKSEEKWKAAVAQSTTEGKASEIQKLFSNTPKGDFAQVLAEAIGESTDFKVPAYLKAAIEAIVK